MLKYPKRNRRKHDPKGLTIIYEDDDIVVVDKDTGLLTVGTDKDKDRTAFARLNYYVRKGNPKSRHRVFIVHRLDRAVSGILVFAKSVDVKRTLQTSWDEVEKHYLAVVHGSPPEAEGKISSWLATNGVNDVYSTRDTHEGKLSHTEYKVIGHSRGDTLLDIKLLTGRKHQIRVHLSENELPIVGDKRYGDKGDGARRIGLHASTIAFAHPRTKEPCLFEAETPSFFSPARFSDGFRPPT